MRAGITPTVREGSHPNFTGKLAVLESRTMLITTAKVNNGVIQIDSKDLPDGTILSKFGVMSAP